jgi:hypothetical protein
MLVNGSLLICKVFEMLNKANLRTSTFFLALFLGAFTWSHAQTTVYDFNSGDDAGWTRYDPLSLGSYTFEDGYYHIQSAAPGTGNFGPARAGSIVTGLTVTDFTISVDLIDWDPSLAQSIGIMARVSDVGAGTSNGYFFQFNPGSQNARHFDDITIDVLAGEQAIESSGKVTLGTPLEIGSSYRMVFQGIGNVFTGSIYDLNDLVNALDTVVFTDEENTYTNGFVGILAADTSVNGPAGDPLGAADATFDNFSVTAVPEPAAYAVIFGMAGLGLAAIRRRRTHR